MRQNNLSSILQPPLLVPKEKDRMNEFPLSPQVVSSSSHCGSRWKPHRLAANEYSLGRTDGRAQTFIHTQTDRQSAHTLTGNGLRARAWDIADFTIAV